MRFKKSLVSLCVVSVLVSGVCAKPLASANGRGNDAAADAQERPIRLYARAGERPLGRVESLSQFAVNGREAFGQQLIWGGELLRATTTGIRISFAECGEATLSRGTLARFARGTMRFEPEAESGAVAAFETVVASLVQGEIGIRLRDDARAYIESCGVAFAASAGAHFRVLARDGRATVTVARGDVQQVQTQQKQYFIRPVGMGASLSVRARSTRQIQIQVTDENDRPVPDVPVLFALGSGGGGSFGGATAATTLTVTTNAQGIATTTFTAGANPASTSITASVPGSNASLTTSVNISAATGFLTTTTTLLLIAAGAAVTTAVVVATRNGDDREAIRVQPPDIRPQSRP